MGYRLLRLHCDNRSYAPRRLLYSEITRFPDALDIVREHGPHRLNEALADRFARLMLAGHLHPSDPAQAAEQPMALLIGPMEARSEMGTRQIGNAELRQAAVAAVRTFLLAFGEQRVNGSWWLHPETLTRQSLSVLSDCRYWLLPVDPGRRW